MSGLGDIVLLRPLWLLVLPGLVILALFLRRKNADLGDWHRAIDPVLLNALRALGHVETGGLRAAHLAGLTAAGVVVLALSGPAIERRDAPAYRNMDGVVFVLDVSPSVMQGGNWSAMQTLGRFGIAALGSRPAGLVVYAGDAYVAEDLTGDTGQLGLTLSLIDDQTVPDPGSRPHLGLELALEMVQGAQLLAGDVVLITDGAGLSPETMKIAGAMAAQGARLSVAVPASNTAVQTLATVGGGQVFVLSQVDQFSGFLRRPDRQRLERQDYPLLFRVDLGRYMLVLALVPVLMLFRRRIA